MFHPLNLRLKANADKNLRYPEKLFIFFTTLKGGRGCDLQSVVSQEFVSRIEV